MFLKKSHLASMPFIVLLLAVWSCNENKSENTKIKGKIYTITLNNDGTIGKDTNYAAKTVVYLIPQNDSLKKKKDKTGKKGGFHFNNLRKGLYHLKVLSKSKTTGKRDSVIVRKINVTGAQRVLKLEKLIIYI